MRPCWGEGGVGLLKGGRGGVERKLFVAEGGKRADGSIR